MKKSGRNRYPTYPAYKPSGVPWLGDIPAHWEVVRLKFLASVRVSNVDKKTVDGQLPVQLCNYIDVYYHEKITPDLDFMQATATFEQIETFSLKKQDVLITKDSESWDDIAVSALVTQDMPNVLCGYHLALIRPDKNRADGRFLARAFSAIGPKDQFEIAANGITRFGLTAYAIKNATFPLPPLPEQRAIARFLDRETGRIDALIARKQRLIELLREKRAALITRAVTRGLNPDAPLKDSGVPWLGKIPGHWEVRKLKYLVKTPLQYGANEPSSFSDPTQPRYIRITDIDDDGTLRSETFKSLPEEIARPYLLQEGDLLFARSGATVGKSFLYSASWGRACFAGYLIRAQLDLKKCAPKFIYYFVNSRSYWNWVENILIQATIQNISAEKYANLFIPTPSIPEQRAIADYLDRETGRIDALIQKIEASIETWKEYRTALITAAVTGKIDVREKGSR